jgi:hypothetical protein
VLRLRSERESNHVHSRCYVAFARLPQCTYEWAAVSTADSANHFSLVCRSAAVRAGERVTDALAPRASVRCFDRLLAAVQRTCEAIVTWGYRVHCKKGATTAMGMRSEQLSQCERLYLPLWEGAAHSRTLGQQGGDLGME